MRRATIPEAMSDDADQPSRAPFVFLAGLVLFLASLAAFVADLVTGHDVLRSLAANAVGVAVLVTWAAYDTLVDPTSNVDTRGGAAGTGVLLCGVYLVLAAVVVGVTSVVHGRLELAMWAGGLGLVFVVLGFVAFPSEAVVEDEASDAESGTSESDGTGDQETEGPSAETPREGP